MVVSNAKMTCCLKSKECPAEFRIRGKAIPAAVPVCRRLRYFILASKSSETKIVLVIAFIAGEIEALMEDEGKCVLKSKQIRR